MYDLVASTTTMSMYMSDQNSLLGAYIGAGTFTALTDPFTLLHGTTQ